MHSGLSMQNWKPAVRVSRNQLTRQENAAHGEALNYQIPLNEHFYELWEKSALFSEFIN